MNANIIYHNLAKERGMESAYRRLLCVILSMLLLGIVIESNLSAKEILVLSARDSLPVNSAAITVYNEFRDSIANTSSDDSGRASILGEGRYVMVRHDMFVPLMSKLRQGEKTDTLRLKNVTEIDELVVDASGNEGKGFSRSYYIPREDMKRYLNVLQSLNEIPNLIVMSDDDIYFEGSGNVKLLLNGVDTSIIEVRALDKDDILRVDTYSVAPPQYRIEGYESVIDIITKSSLVGGNASVSINQAPYPLIGRNSAAIFHNYNKSRFYAVYSNSNGHYRRERQSEFLDYEFDGVSYYKHKEGLDSHADIDENSLTLGYQLVDPGSYMYSVKLSGALSRNGHDMLQRVSSQSNPTPYDADNEVYIGTNDFVLNNYFEKTFGEGGNRSTLVANLTLQRANSDYMSAYREFELGGTIPSVNACSEYDIQYSNAVANLIYYLPGKSWGSLGFSLYDGYNCSRYKEPGNSTMQRMNSAGAWTQYTGYFNKFVVLSTVGIENQYMDVSVNGNKYNKWRPSVLAYLYYVPLQNLQFRLSYSYSTSNPLISQLSQTYQWLDTRLIFHGNPDLHSYTTHKLGLGINYYFKYLEISFSGYYTDTPGRICENFQKGPDSMIETLINLDKYRDLSGQRQFTVKPLGSSVWTLDALVVGAVIKGASPTYAWTGYRYQFMASTAVNLDKWSISASYQYPGRVAVGQLIRPRTQAYSARCYYRPNENIAVGLSIECPFSKGWKESERTVKESPVQMITEYCSGDRANLVSLMFEWNISYGKNRASRQNHRINILTEEKGVLRK